ncbi:putative isomerase YbhE [Thozetella sp. PMI_491]|nr:putative isomerase YbhE [Thozetella sp. PMI_491]
MYALAVAAVLLGLCEAHASKPAPIRILQGGYNATYSVLEFDPYVTPNTLKVVNYYNTCEGNLKPWLSRHPVNPNIVLGCNDNAVPNAPGYLTSYSLNQRTGKLQYIDSVNTGGFPVPDYSIAAAHCAFYNGGTVAGVANYFGQSAATFEFDSTTGRFGAQINKAILEFPGYTPKPGQIGEAGNDNSSQATSHPHQIVTHPWLPVLYLPDLGEDLIHMYHISTNGTLTNFTQYQFPYGSGPRHVAITPNGQVMYVLMELAAKLRTFSINQTTGEITQVGADLPIYDPATTVFSLNISAAEVHQPSDTISIYAASAKDGTLTRIQTAVAPGSRQIRSMELSPAGTTASAGGEDFVVAGGLKTANTFVFRRDRATGMLTLAASVNGTYQPATYLWL